MARFLSVIFATMTRNRSLEEIAHIEEEIYGRAEPTVIDQSDQDAMFAMVRGGP